jgi:hypothetical protein
MHILAAILSGLCALAAAVMLPELIETDAEVQQRIRACLAVTRGDPMQCGREKGWDLQALATFGGLAGAAVLWACIATLLARTARIEAALTRREDGAGHG